VSHAIWTTQRRSGVAVTAAGVVGIGVGSVLGAMAISDWSNAKQQCGSGCGPTSQAYATKSTGETDATGSTVAFVAGGVLAAGGLVLFLTASSGTSSTSAAVMPTLGGAQVVGHF
jgi:hypothetical protein